MDSDKVLGHHGSLGGVPIGECGIHLEVCAGENSGIAVHFCKSAVESFGASAWRTEKNGGGRRKQPAGQEEATSRAGAGQEEGRRRAGG